MLCKDLPECDENVATRIVLPIIFFSALTLDRLIEVFLLLSHPSSLLSYSLLITALSILSQ